MNNQHTFQAVTHRDISMRSHDEMTSRDYYFESHAHFSQHEQVLKDKYRTDAYKDAIYNNMHLFKDKIVLDVGCGTGIFCMFAAQAGAKMVIGVDNSPMVEQAKEIIKKNKFDKIVHIMRGKIEDVELPVEKVDIIISDWMGSCLFYESMLETVLYARDKWLVKDGLMFPDRATLYVCGIEDAYYKEKKLDYWDHVYGFNMSSMKQLFLQEPLVGVVNEEAVVTNKCLLKEFDIQTGKKEEISFESPFLLQIRRSDYIHALVTFFKVEFTKCQKRVKFSTAAKAPLTHWRQTTFYLRDFMTCKKGEEILGLFKMETNPGKRDLDFDIKVCLEGEMCQLKEFNKYRMC